MGGLLFSKRLKQQQIARMKQRGKRARTKPKKAFEPVEQKKA